ncbi:sulfite exporter TauE/SafE family protein [Sinorhizobium americanum]|nr:sulfite exporter TauE/SafE family protein [Sinorhizobium americanum]OAP39756.1 hypothetical protein ATC00_08540 [Sinorhizobium americanum]
MDGQFTATGLIVAALAAFIVGLSKGGLPGVGTLAVPLLAWVMPPLSAAALLLPIYLLSDWVGLYLYRRHYSPENLQTLIPSALVGVAIGWVASASLSGPFIGMMIGFVGVCFCLNIWLAQWIQPIASDKPRSIVAGVFWGAVSGLTSYVSHSGAAAFQIYVLPQRLEKLKFAGTATILFAIVNAAKVVPYWSLAQFPTMTLSATAYLAPIAILGTIAGRRSLDAIPTKLFFSLVQIVLLSVSLSLIVRYAAELSPLKPIP